eukprot:241640_1
MADRVSDRVGSADETPLRSDGISMGGYKRRQCGCLWIIFIIAGLAGVASFFLFIFNVSHNTEYDLIYCILLICWGLATVWVQIEDRGEHLLIQYGPCRWMLCGMGKEKIPYDRIRDFEETQTCAYGFGINCNAIKLFNTCSCCCGDMGRCCGHSVIRITVQERPQGFGAVDANDCCWERCFLNCCCGDRGKYIGKGCCCQPCCNPCNANCCMLNTIFVSTNDPEGLMQLLREKTGRGDVSDHVTI